MECLAAGTCNALMMVALAGTCVTFVMVSLAGTHNALVMIARADTCNRIHRIHTHFWGPLGSWGPFTHFFISFLIPLLVLGGVSCPIGLIRILTNHGEFLNGSWLLRLRNTTRYNELVMIALAGTCNTFVMIDFAGTCNALVMIALTGTCSNPRLFRFLHPRKPLSRFCSQGSKAICNPKSRRKGLAGTFATYVMMSLAGTCKTLVMIFAGT